MPIVNGKESLREWKEIHHDETIECLTGYHEDALFYNCTIKKIKDCVLKNCCLSETKFEIDDPRDFFGVTMTLDCHHFSNVRFSDAAFDYFLLLLLRSKGNTEKRLKIIELLGGKEKVSKMLNVSFAGENWWQQ